MLAAGGFAEGEIVGSDGNAQRGIDAVVAVGAMIEYQVINGSGRGGKSLAEAGAADAVANGIKILAAVLGRTETG